MSKKPWCVNERDSSCDCEEGSCWAGLNAGYLLKLNTLLGYGLSIQEAAGDMEGDKLIPYTTTDRRK